MTRSLLFAGSALVLSLGYARAAPGTPSAPASSDAAAVLQVRGDHAGARAEAKRVLAARPSDAEALLVGACAAIEQRHLDAAESFAGRLAARAPPDPRAPVLVGLVSRRRAHPSEPMLTSLANAWREAGRPDLSAVPQAGGPALWDRAFPALDGGSLGSLRPGQQLVLAQRELDDDRRPLAIAVARAPDGQPLVVLLHALYAIRGPNGSPPPDPVLVGALARAVVAAEPDNGMLALAGWLARTPRDAPLAEGDAAALTSFARMPRFEYPARRLARELVELARPVDPWAESLPARRPDVHLPYTVIHLAYRVVPTTERARAQGEANPAIAAARIASDGAFASARRVMSSSTSMISNRPILPLNPV
jgi:hypothetical protein